MYFIWILISFVFLLEYNFIFPLKQYLVWIGKAEGICINMWQDKIFPFRIYPCFGCKLLITLITPYHNINAINAINLRHSVITLFTPCLASPQPQVSYPRAGLPPPSLIHLLELGFVGLLNNPRRIFAQLQKLEMKLART